MKNTKKTKHVVLLCFVVAAAVAVEEAVAQTSVEQSSGPLIAQRSRRTTSSRRTSFDRRAPTTQQGMGYDTRFGGSTYRDPRGSLGSGTDRRGYSSRDQRGRSTRYQDPYDRSGARVGQPQRAGQEQRPGVTSPEGRRTARPGGTARPAGKMGTGKPGETTVEVAKPTKPRTPPRGEQTGRTRTPAPPKEVKPQAQWPTFYLTLNADQIIVGDAFSMDLQLSNPKKAGFDRLSVVLQFDPVFLRPVKGPPTAEDESAELAASMIDEATFAPARRRIMAVADTKKQPYIREAFSQGNRLSLYENVVDTEQGLINYMFELENETATARGRVASIFFEALQPTRRTFVSFRFGKPPAEGLEAASELGTALVRGSEDVLGLPLRPDDGTIDRGITILSEKPSKTRVRSLEPRRTSEEVFTTRLRLVPESRRIVVDEEFNVYVELENPDHIRFDQVSLLIAYNPRVLEVIDYDADNAITRGVNIHDGSYRDVFPFDFFLVNRVNPETGLIDYRMRGYRRPLLSEGVLGCIRFRAVKSTSKTTLRMFIDRDGQDPTTGVFYRFKDVLADSADPTDGISTCSLRIGRLRSAAAEEHRELRVGG